MLKYVTKIPNGNILVNFSVFECDKCKNELPENFPRFENEEGGILNAHHIKKFKDYPKLRLEISNGITLCVECHRKAHTRKCEVENE